MQLTKKSTPKRYTDRPFPPYRYVPGKAPHPTRDPEGHSYNKHTAEPVIFEHEKWQTSYEYLYGIDLFNHGYWWEAHEALESVWLAAGRQTETGLFIQGLIQIAVAHLKMHQGFNDVAVRMAKDGLDKMKHINGIYLGIDVDALRSTVKTFYTAEGESPVIIDLEIGN